MLLMQQIGAHIEMVFSAIVLEMLIMVSLLLVLLPNIGSLRTLGVQDGENLDSFELPEITHVLFAIIHLILMYEDEND